VYSLEKERKITMSTNPTWKCDLTSCKFWHENQEGNCVSFWECRYANCRTQLAEDHRNFDDNIETLGIENKRLWEEKEELLRVNDLQSQTINAQNEDKRKLRSQLAEWENAWDTLEKSLVEEFDMLPNCLQLRKLRSLDPRKKE
jgi:hypothetical protein